MRRHFSLVVTSAIVLIGGVGVLEDGAVSLRHSATASYSTSVRSNRARREGRPARIGPATGPLDGSARSTPLPYLFMVRPLTARPRLDGFGSAVPIPAAATPAQWQAPRDCESGNRYGEDSGNGYYGAYQFALTTWWALGYRGLPNEAPPPVQDRAARRLQLIAGWSAWPVCSVVVGL